MKKKTQTNVICFCAIHVLERKKGETNNTENRGERVRGLCRFLNLSAVGVASCLSCSSVKVCVVKQQEN